MNGPWMLEKFTERTSGGYGKSNYVFIVGHGRDGSTLLQHALNSSVAGARLVGENVIGLQLASMVGTMASDSWIGNRAPPRSDFSTHPWYGINRINPDRMTRKITQIFHEEIFGAKPQKNRVLGLKEVRWFDFPFTFLGIQTLFPGARFVFLERSPHDMANSGWWKSLPYAVKTIEQRQEIANEHYIRLGRFAIKVSFDELIESPSCAKRISEFASLDIKEAAWKEAIRGRLSHNGGKPPWLALQSPATVKGVTGE